MLERWSDAVRRGEAPTREAWWDDLRQLGAIDLETARRLAEGGRRWPWTPPFELDQVEELSRRAVEPEARALIHRAAASKLEAQLHQAPDPFSRDLSSPALPTSDHSGPSALEDLQIPDEPKIFPAHQTFSASPVLVRAPDRAVSDPAGWLDKSRPTAPKSADAAGLRAVLAAAGPWRRHWLPIAAGVSVVLLLLLALRLLQHRESPPIPSSASIELEPAPPLSSPVSAAPTAILLEMADALEASSDPRLRALFECHVEPLLTLDGEAISHRQEMADAVLATTILRSGTHFSGLARETPLLMAVHCGQIGPPRRERPADCPTGLPVEALRELIDWIWTSADAREPFAQSSRESAENAP